MRICTWRNISQNSDVSLSTLSSLDGQHISVSYRTLDTVFYLSGDVSCLIKYDTPQDMFMKLHSINVFAAIRDFQYFDVLVSSFVENFIRRQVPC